MPIALRKGGLVRGFGSLQLAPQLLDQQADEAGLGEARLPGLLGRSGQKLTGLVLLALAQRDPAPLARMEDLEDSEVRLELLPELSSGSLHPALDEKHPGEGSVRQGARRDVVSGTCELDRLLRMDQHPASLDGPGGEKGDSTLADLVAEDEADLPGDRLERRVLAERVEEALDTLSEKEQRILRQRFGLDGVDPRSLESIGRDYGVTRERIRQIELKALAKLRSLRRRHYLEDFA